MADADELIVKTLLAADFVRATFAGPARSADNPWKRVAVRPVQIRGERRLQFVRFDGRSTFTQNHTPDAAADEARRLIAARFAGVHLVRSGEEIDVRTTKKGKVIVGRRAADAVAETVHNRTKTVPLPEGRPDRLLELTGIATSDGRVKPTMRAKFTQINEFLKHFDHCFEPTAYPSPVRILDCGSGAAYLTLAVHHYLNDIRRIPAEVVGVDVNDRLIRESTAKANVWSAEGPRFVGGAIARTDEPADVVIALHACDTATDDALARAVRIGAKLILSVPCCHHHLNRQLATVGAPDSFAAVVRHGILRERTADIVTDALRAAALRVCGYRAEVVEFVGLEHTARNLMIRATAGGGVGDPTAWAEYRALKRFWGVTPYIETVLEFAEPDRPDGNPVRL